MIKQQLTQKALAPLIGFKDEHTVGKLFKNPDKVRLSHITAIAEALGAPPLEYDEYIVRISSADDLKKLVKGR